MFSSVKCLGNYVLLGLVLDEQRLPLLVTINNCEDGGENHDDFRDGHSFESNIVPQQ